MGVWIETRIKHRQIADRYVTPCMGVWIETGIPKWLKPVLPSHPVWVCGLKHEGSAIDGERLLSYPVWVCGLKHPR